MNLGRLQPFHPRPVTVICNDRRLGLLLRMLRGVMMYLMMMRRGRRNLAAMRVHVAVLRTVTVYMGMVVTADDRHFLTMTPL